MKLFTGLCSKVKETVVKHKPALVQSMVATGAMSLLTVPAFAAELPSPLPTVAITQDMLTPLVEGVVANIGVILPIGLGLFAIMIGIRIVPSLINRFLH